MQPMTVTALGTEESMGPLQGWQEAIDIGTELTDMEVPLAKRKRRRVAVMVMSAGMERVGWVCVAACVALGCSSAGLEKLG